MRPFSITSHRFTWYSWVAALATSFLFLCLLDYALPTNAQSDLAGQVLIRVRDRVTEEQLEQVQVQLIRFPEGIVDERFTGSDGNVQFSGLSFGAYRIRAARRGYEPGETQIDLSHSDGTLESVEISLIPRKSEGTGKSQGVVAASALKAPDKAKRELERGRRFLNEEKDYGRSIAAFQKAIQLYPGYADAYFLMGTAQMQTGAASNAEASLRKAITLDARFPAPYYPLALLLFAEKRYSEEKELLLEAQKLDPADWRWPFELARCLAQQSQWDGALSYGLKATRSANVPPRVHLLVADIYSNSGRPREAVAELELFAKLDPKSSYMERVSQVLSVLRQRSTASALPSTEPR